MWVSLFLLGMVLWADSCYPFPPFPLIILSWVEHEIIGSLCFWQKLSWISHFSHGVKRRNMKGLSYTTKKMLPIYKNNYLYAGQALQNTLLNQIGMTQRSESTPKKGTGGHELSGEKRKGKAGWRESKKQRPLFKKEVQKQLRRRVIQWPLTSRGAALL